MSGKGEGDDREMGQQAQTTDQQTMKGGGTGKKNIIIIIINKGNCSGPYTSITLSFIIFVLFIMEVSISGLFVC